MFFIGLSFEQDLLQSALCTLFFILQSLIVVVLLGKVMRKIFFGQLRAAEFEHLMERLEQKSVGLIGVFLYLCLVDEMKMFLELFTSTLLLLSSLRS